MNWHTKPEKNEKNTGGEIVRTLDAQKGPNCLLVCTHFVLYCKEYNEQRYLLY